MEKWAVIRNSDKSKEGLSISSLKEEIKNLKSEGYRILDERF